MKLVNKLFNSVVAISLVLIFVTPAFAYLDPGTGSAVLQGLLGVLAAIAVALKLYWHKLLRLLGIRKKLEDTGKEDSQTIEEENK